MFPDKSGPTLNELEVTLFGPGYGECVVIHAEGNWLIIDSCFNSKTKLPYAYEYLQSINVPHAAIKLIACTHWHDDHTKGISELYKIYSSSEFCMSAALGQKEFIELTMQYRNWKNEGNFVSSGVSEISKVFDTARHRNKLPKLVMADRRIWQSPSGKVELFSLSPSDHAMSSALTQINNSLPISGTNQNRVSIKSPNHIAVAMHLRFENFSVLLGSDLEEHGNSATGWSAIVNSTARPQTKATLYKVAHHGSPNGDHDQIWKDLLDTPISIVTPFTRGRRPLPSAVDQLRIKSNSSQLHVTARSVQKIAKRTTQVTKMLKGKNLSLLNPSFGAVRCRIDSSDTSPQWKVEHGADAYQYQTIA